MAESTKSNLVEKGFGSYFPIILALCVILGLPSAMLINTASIFYEPIANDIAGGTQNLAMVSAWMSLCLLSCALFSPIIGRWMEKYDIRILMVVSILVEVVAFLIFSVATAPWQLWVVGFICGIPNTILMGMSAWPFDRYLHRICWSWRCNLPGDWPVYHGCCWLAFHL